MPSLSIITPTVGRASLCATCDSVQAQIGPYDEHIIVSDGPPAEWVVQYAAPLPRTRIIETRKTGGYGATQRDAGIAVASGDYLLFLDDDDVFNPGAIALVRQAIADDPGALFLFRQEFNGYGGSLPNGTVLWREPVIRDGNVGTGMIVCPRRDDLPKWVTAGVLTYNCDYWFINATALLTDWVIWRQEVIQTMRPHLRML